MDSLRWYAFSDKKYIVPLVLSKLKEELSKIMDSEDPNFVGFPSDSNQVADNWSNAIYEYSKTCIPLSTSATSAKAAMKSVMMGMGAPMSGLTVFPAAFTAYAATFAPGMLGAGFTGVPPSSPIDLAPVFSIPLNAGTNQMRVNAMAAIIHAWFKTGSATLIAPPNTTLLWT